MKHIRTIIAALLVSVMASSYSTGIVLASEEKRAVLSTVTSEIEAISLSGQQSAAQLEANSIEQSNLRRDIEVYGIRANYLRENIEITRTKLVHIGETKPENILQAALLSISNGYAKMELADILAAVHSSLEEFQSYKGDYFKNEDRIAIEEGLKDKLAQLEADLATVETIVSGNEEAIVSLDAANADLNVIISDTTIQVEQLSTQKTQLEQEIQVEEERQRQIELERQRATTFIKPTSGRLTSGYGNRRHPVTGRYSFHAGIDLANSKGTGILASRNGKVVFAGNQGTYGKLIIISHGSGIETAYAHLSAINVSVGQTVTQGEQIGKMGSTGRSTGSHLHFEIRMNGGTVNPQKYIN